MKKNNFIVRPLAVATALALCSTGALAAQINGADVGSTITNEKIKSEDPVIFVFGQGNVTVQTNASIGTMLSNFNNQVGGVNLINF